MAYIIFDLDHTVIDSSHRQLTRPDGSLDLDHWRENCTRDKIMADSLLPLATSMRSMFSAGHTIIVCTARLCSPHDMEFLARHDLRYHYFLSRADGDNRGDAEMKIDLLNGLARDLGYTRIKDMAAIMFDDNLKVLAAAWRERIYAINAIKENRRLRLAGVA